MQKYGLLLCLLALLSACGGEFSYKRGATGKDLADTRKLCQSEASQGDAAVNECLKRNGWAVQKLDDLELFAVASVTSNKQGGAASEDFPSLDQSDKKTTVEEAPSKSESKIESKNTSVENKQQTAAAKPNERKATSTPKKPANPLDIYYISSWWKMGSNRANLEADMEGCQTELGEAHKPDHKNQKFTLGMVVCMHQKGWKALKRAN